MTDKEINELANQIEALEPAVKKTCELLPGSAYCFPGSGRGADADREQLKPGSHESGYRQVKQEKSDTVNELDEFLFLMSINPDLREICLAILRQQVPPDVLLARKRLRPFRETPHSNSV